MIKERAQIRDLFLDYFLKWCCALSHHYNEIIDFNKILGR